MNINQGNNSITKKSIQPVFTQHKYFISSLNHPISHTIVEEIRNDHENDVNPHIICGTLCLNSVLPVHSSVKIALNP